MNNNSLQNEAKIRRREFLIALAAAMVAPGGLFAQSISTSQPTTELPAAAPTPWTLGLNPSTPVPATEPAEIAAEYDLYFFTTTQIATLSRLSDIFMPRTAKNAGALDAETPGFMDFLIGESPADRKTLYQDGLNWLDLSAKQKFQRPFAQIKTEQADHLLKPWLRTWMPDHLPTEPHARFVNTIHADIRKATLNSCAWNTKHAKDSEEVIETGLYWSPITPDSWTREIGMKGRK